MGGGAAAVSDGGADREAMLRRWGSAGWAYVRSHTHPETGLVASTETFPFVTLWDVANLLLAISSAERLGFERPATVQARAERALESVSRLPQVEHEGARLPNQFARYDTLAPADATGASPGTPAWSATDIGWYLLATSWLAERHPAWRRAIEASRASWNVEPSLSDGAIEGWRADRGRFHEGRYPYGVLASAGYRAAGFRVGTEPRLEAVRLYGQDVHWERHGLTTAEPFLLSALLEARADAFGLADSWDAIARVQEARAAATGVPTAASETPLDVAPYYAYFCTVSGHESAPGVPFVIVADGRPQPAAGGLQVVASRVVAAGLATTSSDYWAQLAAAIDPLVCSPDGLSTGVYAVGAYPLRVRDLNSNALAVAFAALRARA